MTKTLRPAVIDFETEKIEPRPHYPPQPVGLSVRLPGQRKGRYYAFGHPEGNNATREEAVAALREAYAAKDGVVMHNAKFDLDVAETHFGVSPPPPELVHDTMILGFLNDPHSKRLALKELGPRILERAPDERDVLRDWIIENVPEARRKKSEWGAYISRAPGGLAGNYANSDCEFTLGLFNALHSKVMSAGMGEAYLRELKLIPLLLENERQGVRVDLPQLRDDVARYSDVLTKCDAWIFKTLKTGEFNLDSDAELADAIEGVSPDIKWVLTEKGNRSTSKENLKEALGDSPLVAMLEYRATLATCLRTFMGPWLAVAEETNGWIHTQWNQIAQEKGGGTRTGRFSTSPNFQNLPTAEKIEAAELAARKLKLRWLPALPRVRSYVIADKDSHLLLDRDFNGQELRVAAHFEDADMLSAYVKNPNIDLHQYGADKIREYVGLDLPRKKVKIIVFTILYGGGLKTIAERLETTVENAKKLRDAYFKVFPGIKALGDEMRRRGRANLPIVTWGGRVYYAEPSKVVNGQLREFSYKLVNFLIQASSADITKEAMLRYNATRKDSRLVLTVHDQIIISAPSKVWKREMSTLREAMNSIELDAPLLSEGMVGPRWDGMEKAE